MKEIPDDPIIACMERTGYPTWVRDYEDYDSYEDDEEDDDDLRRSNDGPALVYAGRRV